MRQQAIEVPLGVEKLIQIDGSLWRWREPLGKWFDFLDRFHPESEASDTEALAGYWYSERTTVGTLACAISQNPKAQVLEEYKTYRGSGKKYGRGDLWWCEDGIEYTVEAKQCWPKTIAALKKKAPAELKGAAMQCRSNRAGGDISLAVAFCVPRLKKKPGDGEIEAWRAAALSIKANMKAIYLRSNAPLSTVDAYYYPGIILLGQQVK